MNNNDVQYYINEEKRTVVAIIKCDINLPNKIFDRVFVNYQGDVKNSPVANGYCCYNDFCINKRFVGIAKCSPNDTFNVEFGKKLALQRAKVKKAKAVEKKYFKIVNAIEHLADLTGEKYNELYRNWVEESEREQKLLQMVSDNINSSKID